MARFAKIHVYAFVLYFKLKFKYLFRFRNAVPPPQTEVAFCRTRDPIAIRLPCDRKETAYTQQMAPQTLLMNAKAEPDSQRCEASVPLRKTS